MSARTQDLARASCTPAAACPAAHRRPEAGTVAAPHGPAAVPPVQAAHPVPGPGRWAPAVLPAGGGTARRRESGPLVSRQAPRSSTSPFHHAGGDGLLGRGAVEVVQIIEKVGPVVGAGFVVGHKDDGLGGTDLHAQPAIAALVHLDIEARQQPVLGFAGGLDVDAAVGADPLALEADDALVVVGLGVDGT